jgi:hypothetical protein
VILHLVLDGHRLLLTADTGTPSLTQAADYMDALGLTATPLRFMQLPHHGSTRNVGPTILNRLLDRVLGGPAVHAAYSGSLSLSRVPLTVIRHGRSCSWLPARRHRI